METSDTQALAALYPTESKIINLSLAVALALLGIGIFAPMLTLQKFYLFSNKVSLASGLLQLLQEGQVFLFVLIFAFSIIFPFFKLFLLCKVWNGETGDRERHEKHLHWIAQYGKWSMLDVFVVAILLVTVKLGVIADVEVHYGLYAFAASVVITMFITARIAIVINTLEGTR